MYAVIRTGGKQYRVAEKDTLIVEKLEGAAGDVVTIEDVLFIGGDSPQFGDPLIARRKERQKAQACGRGG